MSPLAYLLNVIWILFCLTVTVSAYAEKVKCASQQNLDYALTASNVTPISSTAISSLSPAGNQMLISGCTPTAWIKMHFMLDELADIESTNVIINGQQYYFKIRSLQGISVGNIATEYIVQHGFIGFSLVAPSIGQTTQINHLAGNTEGINLLSQDSYQSLKQLQSNFQVGLDIVQAQIYLDALPDDDSIIDMLTHLSIELDLGHPQLSLATPIENDPNITPEKSIFTQFNQHRLKVNVRGIQINKPTCTVAEQTVVLAPISSTAFDTAKNAGTPQPFSLDILCNGYLNNRHFSATVIDNNQLDNHNQIGYISNTRGMEYSNVGVQLRDQNAIPLEIGTETKLLMNQSGSQFKKVLNAQYYAQTLPAHIGRVFAQATIMLSYR